MNAEEPTRIEYRFTDSSVPPQYHRSWTLVATPDDAQITVDSYGDVLAEKSATMPPDVWDALIAHLPSASSADGPAEGCTGGTSMSVLITSGESIVIERQGDNCGGVEPMADVADWIQPARDLFPPMTDLAPTED